MLPDIANMIASEMEVEEYEKDILRELIPIKEYKKGVMLLKEGAYPVENYFTITGLVRKYYLVDGDEKTTYFYDEGSAISTVSFTSTDIASEYFLECVEDTVLSVLSLENEKKLYEKMPRMESLCRVSMEEDYNNQQKLLSKYITSSPEERYLHLMNTRPELLNRVPQYQLASYLGIKPESLSRIRKRISKK